MGKIVSNLKLFLRSPNLYLSATQILYKGKAKISPNEETYVL